MEGKRKFKLTGAFFEGVQDAAKRAGVAESVLREEMIARATPDLEAAVSKITPQSVAADIARARLAAIEAGG